MELLHSRHAGKASEEFLYLIWFSVVFPRSWYPIRALASHLGTKIHMHRTKIGWIILRAVVVSVLWRLRSWSKFVKSCQFGSRPMQELEGVLSQQFAVMDLATKTDNPAKLTCVSYTDSLLNRLRKHQIFPSLWALKSRIAHATRCFICRLSNCVNKLMVVQVYNPWDQTLDYVLLTSLTRRIEIRLPG